MRNIVETILYPEHIETGNSEYIGYVKMYARGRTQRPEAIRLYFIANAYTCMCNCVREQITAMQCI